MAGRAHKKLLQQQLGADLPPAAPSSEEESSEEEIEGPSTAPFNPFALLTDSEDGGGEAEGSEQEEEEPSSPQAAPPPPPPKPASGGRKAAKKKKKAAGKGKARAADGSDADSEPVATAGAADEEELDAILAEMNLQPAAGVAQPAAAAAGQQGAAAAAGGGRPLLAVDMRQLKADEELRRMFGSRVLEEEGEEGGGAYAGASRRVRRLAARGLLRRQALKPGAIINPRDTWPRFDGGFSMEAQGVTAEGKQQFGYAYSQAYQAVQELYEECQASFDPNNIAALLHSHPYHLDALLTMHDLYRSMGEQAYAEEMLERALYALEMAWHPSFSPAAANMHVPYEEANAPLFICLFRYMQSLSRRGLHRTALEVCKLLLSLNADDPLGALQTIDYLALRAGRYDFLYRLAEQHGGDGSAALLPNFVFSQALACWYQEQEGASSKARSSDAGASGSGGGGSEQRLSADLLVKAVLLYPEAVVRLLRELQSKGVGKDADWAAVLRQPLFAQASDGGSASLGHLLDLWVERQHLLWKAQPVQDWLRAACRQAAEGDPLDLPDGLTAADWACVREQAFPASSENEYGHLRLHDFSDAVARLPPEEIHGMAGAAGAQQADVAALEAEMRALAQQMQNAPDMTEEELQQMNPLMALLRSLLPWTNMGQAPAGEEEGEGGVGDAGQQQQQQEREPGED
ncbi:hypothetical protein ABPG75_006986 [Micractinium tetrahymenae]